MNRLLSKYLCGGLLFVSLVIISVRQAHGEDSGFIHPGLLNSKADLERMKASVAARMEPLFAGYEVFRQHPESQASYTMKGPKEFVGRGAGWTGPPQSIYDADANAAYQCAVMWCITGDKAFADKSIQILNAWSTTLKTIGGRDAVLGAGLGPFKMINAAEIIRYTNAGWSQADIAQAETSFKKAVYPVIKDFSPFANGTWDTAAIKTVIAIGVFCNDRDIYERGLRYYVHGQGNGRLNYYVINDAGECQETGRDSQHSQLGLAHLGDASQIAWNQGLNLYGYADNRLLKAFEYAANYNMGGQVPFQEWMDRTGDNHYIRIAPPGQLRAIYEQIFNHYVNVMGLAAPFTQKAAEQFRPEGQGVGGNAGINGADHIGFGTLLYSQPKATLPRTAPAASPGALIANSEPDGIELTWIEPISAVSSIVKRSCTSGGPFDILEKGITGSSFTDKSARLGTIYYYVVSSINAAGEIRDSLETAICSELPDPWKHQDIGSVQLPGSTQFDGKVFTLEGGGSSIGTNRDELQFAYLPVEGDGTLTARYVPQVSSQHLQFGLLMRATTDPDSSEVAYLIQGTGSNGNGDWNTVLVTRASTDTDATEADLQHLGAPTVNEGRLLQPFWLRLVRTGDTFSAWFSVDGKQWTQSGTTHVALQKSLLTGIGACSRLISHNSSAATTVMMDQVAATGWNYPANGK